MKNILIIIAVFVFASCSKKVEEIKQPELYGPIYWGCSCTGSAINIDSLLILTGTTSGIFYWTTN